MDTLNIPPCDSKSLGRLFLNASSGAYIYFDSETPARKEEFDKLTGDGTYQTTSSSKLVHAQKVEPLTVAELNQYVIIADPQKKDIGNTYDEIRKCSPHKSTSFTYPFPYNRYRVILTVSDATDTAAFLGFDMEVVKLRNIQASEAAQIVGIGVDAQVDTDLPRFLAKIFGNTYTFQLKLKDFNFTSKHQTFTVSCVFPSQELAPAPAFVVNVGRCTPEAAQPEVVATGSDAKVDNTCCVTEAPSTSDGSLAGRKASAKEQIALDENPPNGNHFQNKRFTSRGSVKSIVMYPCIWTFKLAMLIKPFRLQKSVYFPMAPISNMLSSQNIFWPNIYGEKKILSSFLAFKIMKRAKAMLNSLDPHVKQSKRCTTIHFIS
ncbi:hypothetical protein YC2023_057063 [Brassica napus]